MEPVEKPWVLFLNPMKRIHLRLGDILQAWNEKRNSEEKRLWTEFWVEYPGHSSTTGNCVSESMNFIFCLLMPDFFFTRSPPLCELLYRIMAKISTLSNSIRLIPLRPVIVVIFYSCLSLVSTAQYGLCCLLVFLLSLTEIETGILNSISIGWDDQHK